MPGYPAVLFKQTAESSAVVLFAASAVEIDEWAGVPQRELLDGQETVGFQREESATRLQQLSLFNQNPSNVVQNPLLCAIRDESLVTFKPSVGEDVTAPVQIGRLEIDDNTLGALAMGDLFKLLKKQLEVRSPGLISVVPAQERVTALLTRVNEQGYDVAHLLSDVSDLDSGSDDLDEGVSGLFSTETHILEFYQEIVCRLEILTKLNSEQRAEFPDEFLGFSREALEAYVKPVFLVDGQHRLKGALRAAQAISSSRVMGPDSMALDESETRSAEELARDLVFEASRLLPVSMLMNSAPQEHVFQFVVVNQKATPVGKALLGTIVATSLAKDELEGVTDRLEQVGINVADSQAVAWFTRSPESPFCGLVQQGIMNEGGHKLPWSVLRDLVAQFRSLSGATLYYSDKIDYAQLWRKKQLGKSALTGDSDGPEEQMAQWSALNGPWRAVASAFFISVRDVLASTSNPEAFNFWGSTRSNLYNKVSLSILVADFFQWLSDRGLTIDAVESVDALVREWLTDVSPNYFARDWRLSGVKKDTPGIRAQWSELWVNYRKDPTQIPSYTNFRKSKYTGQ